MFKRTKYHSSFTIILYPKHEYILGNILMHKNLSEKMKNMVLRCDGIETGKIVGCPYSSDEFYIRFAGKEVLKLLSIFSGVFFFFVSFSGICTCSLGDFIEVNVLSSSTLASSGFRELPDLECWI